MWVTLETLLQYYRKLQVNHEILGKYQNLRVQNGSQKRAKIFDFLGAERYNISITCLTPSLIKLEKWVKNINIGQNNNIGISITI